MRRARKGGGVGAGRRSQARKHGAGGSAGERVAEVRKVAWFFGLPPGKGEEEKGSERSGYGVGGLAAFRGGLQCWWCGDSRVQ